MKSKSFFLFCIAMLITTLCACQKDSAIDTSSTSKELANWQEEYLSFLDDNKDAYDAFSLVYIDNDNIPELYLKGIAEAGGDAVCSYKQGAVVTEQLNRTGGGSYVAKSGILVNQNGNFGCLYTDIYNLNDHGFTVTFTAEKIENHTPDTVYEYTVDQRTVTETEYNAAIKDAFNSKELIPLNDNTVSYDKIIQQITEQ